MGKFKVIKSGNEFRAYTNEVEVFDDLPPKAYRICWHKMSGYWLEETELQTFEGKMYGDIDRRVNKVFNTYEKRADRNLGILLSGGKGLGKSCLAKRIAAKAMTEYSLPVIVVAKNIGDGLIEFLQSINTNCVVMFDEFDKTFPSTSYDSDSISRNDECDGQNPTNKQDAFLSFFDGVSDKTHKIIVCTCNNIHRCSSFMINRPGRLFYHFRFTSPSRDQYNEYFTDNISEEHKGKIEELVNISCAMQLSFDSIEALCFEVNNGETVENALDDLNIVNGFDAKRYTMTVEFSNGCVAHESVMVSGGELDIEKWLRLEFDDGSYTNVRIAFMTKDMKFDPATGSFTVKNPKMTNCDEGEKLKGISIKRITLKNEVSTFSSGRSIFDLVGRI